MLRDFYTVGQVCWDDLYALLDVQGRECMCNENGQTDRGSTAGRAVGGAMGLAMAG